MVNLKLKKSLAKENYCNQLVIKGTCQVKEVVNYENQKTNPQLIQDLMTFIENEISESKYTKKIKILISLKYYRILSVRHDSLAVNFA